MAFDNFLLQCEKFSFRDLCQDDGREPAALPEDAGCEPTTHVLKVKKKKRRRAKREESDQEKMDDRLKDPHEPSEEHLLEQASKAEPPELDEQNEDEDKEVEASSSHGRPQSPDPSAEEPAFSKRALQKAMYGFKRRSGGKKHRKKGKPVNTTDPYMIG